jgi:hypothetical protein
MSERIKIEWVPDEWGGLTAMGLPKWRFPLHAPTADYDLKLRVMPRPSYCDRGRFAVYAEAPGVDDADMFPRLFFSLDRLKAEMEAWVNARASLRPDPQ